MMKVRNLYLLVFAALLFAIGIQQAAASTEPDYFTINLGMKDGLPSNAVRAIYKDSRGLMWIATDAGVCSYDGRTIKVYSMADGLAGDKVWSIAEDKQGFIWFGCYGGGLSRFDGERFYTINQDNGLASNWVRVLYYSKRFNCLMVGTEYGISVVKDQKLIGITGMTDKKNKQVITDFLDARNYIYVTRYGLPRSKYYPEKNEYVADAPGKSFTIGSSCAAIARSQGDTLWGHNRNGFMVQQQGRLTYDTLNCGQVFRMAEDNERNIWIAACSYYILEPGGVFRFDGNKLKNFSPELGIRDQEVWSVYFDREQDILWVATLNEGLFIASHHGIKSWNAADLGMNRADINMVFADKNDNIWLATRDNLVRFNGTAVDHRLDTAALFRLQLDQWKQDALLSGTMITPQREAFLRRNAFAFDHLVVDPGQSLWVGYTYGSFLYDFSNRQISIKNTHADASLCFGPGNLMYNGSWNGFSVFDTRNNSSMMIDLKKHGNGTWPSGNISRIIRHGADVWIASWSNGIYRANGLNFFNMSSEHGDIYFNVNDICFDNQNHLISADNKGNISISEIRGDKLKVLYTLNGEDGLCGNSVSWILYDGLKYLWAGTNTGLNRIDLEDLLARGVCRINFFDQEEGYTAVSSRNAVLDHQGVLWTGGKEGLVRLNPANLYLARSEKPVIFLADLEINGKQYYHPHYGADSSREHPAGNFTLSNIENRLNFTFNIYNYRNPEKDLFRYKLEGFEQRWSNWTHSRNAFYTNLKPGSYNLCIQSKNVNTGIEAAALEIPFRIIGPWYFRWYSILVFLAVILVPITIISRSRIRQIREVEKEKAAISAKIADLELQALQAQMNPHFIFNAINAIQAYILDNKVDEALLYLSDFAKIVRASLENVNRRTITLEEELDFINSYLNLEKMRFPDKVRWQINLGSQVEPKQLIIPPMVLQPYVENAVRHGIRHKKEGGLLVVKIEILDDNRLHYILEDNGIGRLKSSVLNFRFKLGDTRNEHSTLITEKRIQLLNPKDGQNLYYVKITDLGDETGKATGTRVDIFLPLVRA